MIWFDWFAERRLSHDELRRALSAVAKCGYHDIAVIDNISALCQAVLTCLIVRDINTRFGQQLSVYAEEPLIHALAKQPLRLVAQELAAVTRGQVLIADDESPDPYQMLVFDSRGEQSIVHVEGTLFDDFGIVDFKKS